MSFKFNATTGLLDISNKGTLTAESDPLSLHLDQTSPQTISSGKPIFAAGAQFTGLNSGNLYIKPTSYVSGIGCDITPDTGNIRIGCYDLVNNVCNGAAFQLYSNSSASYKGQLYFDCGSSDGGTTPAALIFRTMAQGTPRNKFLLTTAENTILAADGTTVLFKLTDAGITSFVGAGWRLDAGGFTGVLSASGGKIGLATSSQATADNILVGKDMLFLNGSGIAFKTSGGTELGRCLEMWTDNHLYLSSRNTGGKLYFRTNGTTTAVTIDDSQRSGFGVASPTAVIHLKAGTATASSSPLKFTSGTLLTNAEAGAVEFLTDKWYGCITTGPARKEFTLNDSALTSGRIPFTTTNGRLTDSTNLQWNSSTNAMTIAGGTAQSSFSRGLVVNAAAGSGATYVFNVKSVGDNNLIVTDTANDRVGIGTASPAVKFHVAGDVTVGVGTAGIDYVLKFDGETNDGILTWMEDEDYFKFSDGILMDSTEEIFFRDSGLKIFSQADGYLNIVSDTGTRLGDATPTNYTQFDATGHQTMVGTAKPWTDVRVEPVARTTGTGAPAFEKWLDDSGGTSRGVFLYSFTKEAVLGNEKELFFTLQMPHEWDSGAIHIHVHWIPADSQNTATPRFGLEFAWKEPGATFGDTTIIYATGNEQADTNLTAFKHYITEFTAQTPDATQDGLSSILIGRLFRSSSDAADTYDDKIGILYVDAHFQLNSLGSTDEYTK